MRRPKPVLLPSQQLPGVPGPAGRGPVGHNTPGLTGVGGPPVGQGQPPDRERVLRYRSFVERYVIARATMFRAGQEKEDAWAAQMDAEAILQEHRAPRREVRRRCVMPDVVKDRIGLGWPYWGRDGRQYERYRDGKVRSFIALWDKQWAQAKAQALSQRGRELIKASRRGKRSRRKGIREQGEDYLREAAAMFGHDGERAVAQYMARFGKKKKTV